MGRHAKTQRIIDEAAAILDAFHPMTVRQVHYQLVARLVTENTESRYKALSRYLTDARRKGDIPWERIEDRLRRPRGGGDGWSDAQTYLDSQLDWIARGYRTAIWPEQSRYVEVWLEKDALSGIFDEALAPYHMTYHVGRGYDSWSSVHNAAQSYQRVDKPVTVLYFGDFDPSGEDMARSLRERLAECGACPTIIKVALTKGDIERYHLPEAMTKDSDTRSKKHVAEHGDISVELDALVPPVLRARLVEAVEQHLDMDALAAVREREARDRAWLDRQVDMLRRSRETEGGAG
jgi:hypothetical protein